MEPAGEPEEQRNPKEQVGKPEKLEDVPGEQVRVVTCYMEDWVQKLQSLWKLKAISMT